jgi:ribonuclease Z
MKSACLRTGSTSDVRLQLTVLGTASQQPTRERGQGGYVLRWADELVLFDPGEGCQRQLLLAGISPAKITRTAITHFHGDHCLGLPGFLQSRAQQTDRPITLHYAPGGEKFVDHLLAGSVIDFDLAVRREPIEPGTILELARFSISAANLDHPTPAIGFRLEEPPSRHLVPDLLDQAGLEKLDLQLLKQQGKIRHRGRTVSIEEVSEVRRGPSVAFIMDSSPCDGARRLADRVDLLICESTYLSNEAEMAVTHGHMTAVQAGSLAAGAGVGLLVLSHFSGRYPEPQDFADEASSEFQPVVAARDLSTIEWSTDHAGDPLSVAHR